MTGVSRREFVSLGAVGAAGVPFVLESTTTGAAVPTAQAIADLIRQHVGVEWNPTTVDGFKAGDPSTAVTGIATTSLATIDVMRRAVQAGANLIITSGPTFYSRADTPTPTGRRGAPPQPDPVFTAKREFIEQNRLVVWRFSDHWRARTPDPFAGGVTDALGWAKYRVNGDPRRVTVPAITIETLARDVKAKLNARGDGLVFATYLGGIGDEDARAVALGPGGDIYIGGQSASAAFPLLNPYQSTSRACDRRPGCSSCG